MKKRMSGQFMVLTAILVAFVLVSVSAIVSDFEDREYEVEEDGYMIEMLKSEAGSVNFNVDSEIKSYERQVDMISEYTSEVTFDDSEGCFDVNLRRPGDTIALECLDALDGEALRAGITYDPNNPEPEEDITFEGVDLSEGTEVDQWEWEFEGGGFAQGQTVTHSFDDEGEYIVQLTVYDEHGQETTVSTEVEVEYPPLIVSADYSPINPEPGEDVTFEGIQESGGTDIEQWSWDMDDGTTREGQVVDHDFEDEDVYEVELEVVDEEGRQDSDTVEVDVEFEPLEWVSAEDWNDATSEARVVHEDYGDFSSDRVQLGYSSNMDGLTAMWPLHEDVGTEIEEVVSSNDGEASDLSYGEDGLLGTTVPEFDGSSSGVRIEDDDAWAFDTSFSVVIWAYTYQDPEEYEANMIGDGGAYDDPGFVLFSEGDDNGARWEVQEVEEGEDFRLDTDPFNTFEWNMFVGIYDMPESEGRIYRNTQEYETANLDFDEIDSPHDLGIGEAYWDQDLDQDPFDGRLTFAMTFDKALDQNEIEDLHRTVEDGFLQTGWKDYGVEVSNDDLILQNTDFSLNGGSISVTVESGSGETDTVELEAGQESYNLDMAGTDQEYRLDINIETNDVEESPVFRGAELEPN